MHMVNLKLISQSVATKFNKGWDNEYTTINISCYKHGHKGNNKSIDMLIT